MQMIILAGVILPEVGLTIKHLVAQLPQLVFRIKLILMDAVEQSALLQNNITIAHRLQDIPINAISIDMTLILI